MERELFPLEELCSQIQKALDAELPHLAAAAALALPDICSSLEWDPDPSKVIEQRRSQQQRYRDWYTEYLGKHYRSLSDDDCYRLRCGLLHNGKLGRPQDQYDRVAFTVPPRRGPKEQLYEGNQVNGIDTGKLLVLDLRTFCEFVIAAAREWYEKKRDDPFVKSNMVTLIKLKPEGAPPHFKGLPALVGDTHEVPNVGNFVFVRF